MLIIINLVQGFVIYNLYFHVNNHVTYIKILLHKILVDKILLHKILLHKILVDKILENKILLPAWNVSENSLNHLKT